MNFFVKTSKLFVSLILVFTVAGCGISLSNLTNNLDVNSQIISSEINNERAEQFTDARNEINFPLWKQRREDFKIAFTGDVMLGRYVEELMNSNGLNYPFEKVGERLNLYDEVVINLEGPVLKNALHTKTPDFSTNFSFKEDVLNVFAENNIGIVNLANNHTFDRGEERFQEMVEILNERDIDWFGHPWKYDEEYVHTILAEGVDINLIGFQQATNYEFDINKMKSTVEAVKNDNPLALNIVNFHFGPEYKPYSANIQQEIARGAVDAGADMVIGHHPHVVQEMEVYKEKPIFYSLGNFVFDQYFSTETQEGLVVELVLEFKDVSRSALEPKKDPFILLGGKYEVDKLGVKVLPIKSVRSQPYFLGEPENSIWLDEYREKSQIENQYGEFFYEWGI
jgi:poly-gamma-glutamate synthesis protein (capsule biosynthesis protein)